jgi:hypothetical protein
MDEIKDAFQKVKQDISYLNYELQSLKVSLAELNWNIARLVEDVRDLKLQKRQLVQKIDDSNQILPTTHSPQNPAYPTHNPPDNSSFKPLKPQILGISIGNGGGPTDRQTNQQTDQHMPPAQFLPPKYPSPNNPGNTLQDASKILDSLDTLKKEIRLKFKRLTEREILVFSTLYQLEEEQGHADYKTIAQRLNLTESSIREYVGKIISKGIPVDKTKLNNKNIRLNVSEGLKRVASLQTILKLREL